MPFLYPVAVNCGDLTDPSNGAVNTSSGTTFNMNATYTCNTGYNLIGITPRTCQANETWSGSEPTCNRKFYISLDHCVHCCCGTSLSSLQLSPVKSSLLPPMEWSMNLETPLEAMPPTPVTLATLLMETLPGLVEVMECGVAVNQLVIVS